MDPVLSMTRRVQFAETDMAGVAHFSNYFRMMEELEHAFWRSLGMSVHRGAEGVAEGWPRVAASCEYFAPVRFEDELDMRMRITAVGEKSMSYETEFQHRGRRVALGRMTIVYCALVGGSFQAVPIPQDHGDLTSLGFRFGKLAYSPDISGVPEASIPLLQGLDVWIVDALRFSPHPSHFHLKAALEWIERLGPKRAILTHMTAELDYDALKRDLPAGVEPAYDGMVIEFE